MLRAGLILLTVPVLLLAGEAEFRIEKLPVAGGAELITIFGPLAGAQRVDGLPVVQQAPLVSVLRDTLGDSDPANDRLRSIWVLTSARPTLLQRTAAALPFFYYRPKLDRNADHVPDPVLDMGDTRRDVWAKLAGQLTQVLALDPEGTLVRSASRAYRTNTADLRQTRLLEGLSVLSRAEASVAAGLSETEMHALQARLALAGQALGGLVDDRHLPTAYYKRRARVEETRGHNWELLRQRAETNGLYFEPFGDGISSTHAVLWIAREDLKDTMHRFDAKFLGIENPYVDARLKAWQGFSAIAHFDEQGRRVREGGSTTRELIPLALYSLEYPKVPLLLADFRKPRGPKRREMLSRATNDAIIGVFGISRWGNWPYMAGASVYSFIRSRQGEPNNRAWRLGAYAQTRRWLAFDTQLDPRLREELLKRVDMMGVNPLEESVFQEEQIARRQYAALKRYAADPQGLTRRLERDRDAERTEVAHGFAARLGLLAARVSTLGMYHHHEDWRDLVPALDAKRRAASVVVRSFQ